MNAHTSFKHEYLVVDEVRKKLKVGFAQMSAMNRETKFELSLQPEHQDAILRAFGYLLEHQKDSHWWEDHTLAPLADLQGFTDKLADNTQGAQSLVVSFAEWVTYRAYVDYATQHLPDKKTRYELEDIAGLSDGLEQSDAFPFS